MDWAAMLIRMYEKWALWHYSGESSGGGGCGDTPTSAVELISASHAESGAYNISGRRAIHHACIKVSGDHAYGWLRREVGVHRLVRQSPFDKDSRRHTSFAKVSVTPCISGDASSSGENVPGSVGKCVGSSDSTNISAASATVGGFQDKSQARRQELHQAYFLPASLSAKDLTSSQWKDIIKVDTLKSSG